MAGFHLFLRLPAELRVLIWAYSVQPRNVDVRAIRASRGHRDIHRSWRLSRRPSEDTGPDPYLPVPVPAVMQVCRESRGQRLYEKVIYAHPMPPEQRYAWINFEMDMIDLGAGELDIVEHIAPRIRRLKLERSNGCELWYHWEAKNLTWFENVELYHVVAPEGLAMWFDAWEEHYWACNKESLKFIDKRTGLIVNAVELEQIADAETAEGQREYERELEQQMREMEIQQISTANSTI